jgi:hypothetical protein
MVPAGDGVAVGVDTGSGVGLKAGAGVGVYLWRLASVVGDEHCARTNAKSDTASLMGAWPKIDTRSTEARPE